MQTSQSRSRCGHGQYEGEVSKQEFQGLNLTSNKTDKFALALAEAVGAQKLYGVEGLPHVTFVATVTRNKSKLKGNRRNAFPTANYSIFSLFSH